jgi:hypothetical protein
MSNIIIGEPQERSKAEKVEIVDLRIPVRSQKNTHVDRINDHTEGWIPCGNRLQVLHFQNLSPMFQRLPKSPVRNWMFCDCDRYIDGCFFGGSSVGGALVSFNGVIILIHALIAGRIKLFG